MLAGGVAPFMTIVVGQAFEAFSAFATTTAPFSEAKQQLLHDVGLTAIELVALAVGALALSSVMSSLWIWTGERNQFAIRKMVYHKVTQKDMIWFDLKMGQDELLQTSEGDGPHGAGGLMARFNRETDDVRMASSLASGMLIQHITTTLTGLILAFRGSWSLTLVILSAVPLLVIIQAFSQAFAGPALAMERAQIAAAATVVDRAASAIATVKAFNAELHEQLTLDATLRRMRAAATTCITVWGITTSLTQFVTMAMFVQGFWYGSKLVRQGQISVGDVTAVFWACVIASSNMQMCLPQLVVFAKGKFAMASLVALIESESPHPSYDGTSHAPVGQTPVRTRRKRPTTQIRKIIPQDCAGEIELSEVTFAYPSRPTIPVLKDVNIFLPMGETTFIVGGSGSGKSTIAQLLLRMYDLQHGMIRLDDQDMAYLDENWTRQHVSVVSQTCIMFDMTVHENVAVGLAGHGNGLARRPVFPHHHPQHQQQFSDIRSSYGSVSSEQTEYEYVERRPEDVTREEVEDVCRKALMHEFVRDLPDGYDTKLGNGGANLSGGQKQRLAIARALLRNPTVLILDEATSALDATSRLLVFEAIKRWRRNLTTIVITHDLSQITSDDFVYVLKDGSLVEQGFREDLEKSPETTGEFKRMSIVQGESGGFPEKQIDSMEEEGKAQLEVEAILERQVVEKDEELEAVGLNKKKVKHQSSLRPMTMGSWMLDVVADLTRPAAPAHLAPNREVRPISRFVPAEAFSSDVPPMPLMKMKKEMRLSIPPLPSPIVIPGVNSRRLSLPFTPTSPTSRASTFFSGTLVDEEDVFLERSGTQATRKRLYSSEGVETHGYGHGHSHVHMDMHAHMSPKKRVRARWDEASLAALTAVKVDQQPEMPKESFDPHHHSSGPHPAEEPHPLTFKQFVKNVWTTMPRKPLLVIGMCFSLISGAMTPVFGYLLSHLFVEVSTGAKNVSAINVLGGTVLAVAAADGLFHGLKYSTMEYLGMVWVNHLRHRTLTLVLSQPKRWFDKSENSSVRLMQILVKDGDDARTLIGDVLGQLLAVVAMLGVGLVWALVTGWQLTLVGFAIAPVFAVTMMVQTRLVVGCEVRNKRAREEVAKGYYDAISNVRTIRAMGFESAFQAKFDKSVDDALSTGVRGAFVEGCTYGVASALIYLAEALLFYVGAVLIANGTYDYLRMIQVLNLVVFTVSIGSQMMAFTQRIAKAVQATRDLTRLLKLSPNTEETHGSYRPIFSGSVAFHNVSFSYPERPDVPILKDLSINIAQNECVAIVGASGSGKSTIASLLQRLYEPSSGNITIGSNPIQDMDVHYLREHVAVVSQAPNLFDATIRENISYGNERLTEHEIHQAARQAHVHEFIMSLPKGYDTMLGENASLISGGQAQRLQIARALARPSKILILDECQGGEDDGDGDA
ncbi:hypothetical protein NLI96_g12910 [Meripilus lineatus]|uniref:P-loop containing nucleoside triphosphate hydrolase protein n=1 Tax=Meripilus lineatus TaxID=2056292 RepID=A0AAD5UQC1_9APHY|nr:hypothetical protein NLI96_g12910 [Physisporinus lineatus]